MRSFLCGLALMLQDLLIYTVPESGFNVARHTRLSIDARMDPTHKPRDLIARVFCPGLISAGLSTLTTIILPLVRGPIL